MKYLPVCFVFLLLIFCGGLASRVLFVPSIEQQSSRLLKDAGVNANGDPYEHYFVSLGGLPETEGRQFELKYIGGQVWGGVIAPGEALRVRAEFSTTIQEKGNIFLEGTVHSKQLKTLLDQTAAEAVGTREIRSRLTVDTRIEKPEWSDSIAGLLEKFLSFSGVTHLAVRETEIEMEGKVLSREVREKLGEYAASVVPSPILIKNNLVVKTPKVPSFRVYGSRNSLKFSGFLPNEETRVALIDGVRKVFPKRELKDETTIAAEVENPWWLSNAKKLIPRFFEETGGLGGIEYWKDRLYISGKVSSQSFIDEINSDPLGPEKPEDFIIKSDLVIRPVKNPTLSVFADEKGRIIAQGAVSRGGDKNQILAALIQNDPDRVIVNRINVSSGIRDLTWNSPEKLVSEMMLNTTDGRIRIDSRKVEISGEVDSEIARNQMASFAAEMVGAEGEVNNLLTVKKDPEKSDSPPALNPTEIDFKETAVYFNSGSSSIRSSYSDEISKAADLIKTLDSGTKLIVGGYADHRGNQSANEKLSIRRASAVRDRLTSLGIEKTRLIIKTFGEDVSNISRNDLWKSRRVELSIFKE